MINSTRTKPNQLTHTGNRPSLYGKQTLSSTIGATQASAAAPNESALAGATGPSSSAGFLGQVQAFLRRPGSRRASRKGSQRATSIQQHLAAVRYAESLDRQTHLRRSRGKCARIRCIIRPHPSNSCPVDT